MRSFEPETLLQLPLAGLFAALAYGINQNSKAAAVSAFVLLFLIV